MAPTSSSDQSRPHPIQLVSALRRIPGRSAGQLPPSGTVTFLFTDLEGSTQRWERQPEAMRADREKHAALLAAAVTSHGGHVLKALGDATCAVFASATEALAAALAAQRALSAESWGVAGPLLARMALHTGTAFMQDGDYFGAPLNRVARLLEAGHDGQILLSAAAQELVLDALPAETMLRDLGAHRLKDLDRSEHVYQLLAPDLPAEFPSLRTLEAHPTNLPIQPTPLIGREREVHAVIDLVRRSDVRLVTLTGPGGVGKTRLALQVAADLLPVFTDGVYFIGLAPIREPDLLIPTIARALGMQDAGDQPLLQRLGNFLTQKHLLFVLDNLEQIVAAAPMLADVLACCPYLTVLATSRIPLHLSGEWEFPVPPLGLPDPQRPPVLDEVRHTEAVRLFMERAQAVTPGFVLTEATAGAVAQLCHRLDGLPLAIELAAARCKLLSAPALLARLSDRLQLLTGGPRDAPARLRTMRAAITWSYDLLAPTEQMLFRRLAVFVGGCSLEAAEAVASKAGEVGDTDEGGDVLEALAALVDHSLVRAEQGPDGEPRFTMLETIRAFGQERLQASGQDAAVRRAHAVHFMSLAEHARLAVVLPGGDRWMARLAVEYDNLRSALSWLETAGESEAFLRLAGALSLFWFVRGRYREGSDWLERALARGRTARAKVRARALKGLGLLTLWQGTDRPAALFSEGLALSRALGDPVGESLGLIGLGITAMYQGDYTRAEQCHLEALALARGIGDTVMAAALACAATSELGYMAHAQGNRALAVARFEEALSQDRALGYTWAAANELFGLGFLAHEAGDHARALDLFREALTLAQGYGDQRSLAITLAGVAAVAAAAGQPEQAARLFGALEALRSATGMPESRHRTPYRTAAARGMAAVRAALDADTVASAWAAGRALSLEQAIAEATAVTLAASSTPPSTSPTAAYGLSARELDVLGLLVKRHTDREIADALFLSPRTVGWHVTHILNKLGVDSRHEAADLARSERLV